MYFKIVLLCATWILCPVVAMAQDKTSDGTKFIEELNARLKEKAPGVTVAGALAVATAYSDPFDQAWAKNLTEKSPDFGIVVVDKLNQPIDILGAKAPYEIQNGAVSVPGYDLPQGAKFKLVGSAEWTMAAYEIASARSVRAPNKDIEKAVNVIVNASDYVAEKLCAEKSRPTKLVLNLTAGFELVFNAQTGSQVEWDLEVVCGRYSP